MHSSVIPSYHHTIIPSYHPPSIITSQFKNCDHISARLAPEAYHPHGIYDCIAAYEFLLRQKGVAANRIVIVGDSAGGGAALLTMLDLRQRGIQLPAAAVLTSPWVDLSTTRPSYQKNKASDQLIGDDLLRNVATFVTNTRWEEWEKRKHPRISPIFADLSGLPPLLIHFGTAEALEDEARDLASLARNAGVDVTLKVCACATAAQCQRGCPARRIDRMGWDGMGWDGRWDGMGWTEAQLRMLRKAFCMTPIHDRNGHTCNTCIWYGSSTCLKLQSVSLMLQITFEAKSQRFEFILADFELISR